MDLTGTTIAFTAKRVQSDFDMQDSRAYIAKTFEPQDPELGRFYIQLTSKDTDFEPGKDFFFDIEITKPDTGMVYRICTLTFTLEGGPTNRTVNNGIGQLPVGDEVTIIQLEQGNPIVVIAPMVAFDPNIYNQILKLMEITDNQVEQIEQLQSELELAVERIEYLTNIIEP